MSPALELVGRVLREQGLGRHIDEDFIAAATTEMQEAMGMTPAEFEAAAAALLAAETDGSFRSDANIDPYRHLPSIVCTCFGNRV